MILCNRCRKNESIIMSFFNTDMICLDCEEKGKSTSPISTSKRSREVTNPTETMVTKILMF